MNSIKNRFKVTLKRRYTYSGKPDGYYLKVYDPVSDLFVAHLLTNKGIGLYKRLLDQSEDKILNLCEV